MTKRGPATTAQPANIFSWTLDVCNRGRQAWLDQSNVVIEACWIAFCSLIKALLDDPDLLLC